MTGVDMATYRFFANMHYSHEIEVEADSYDEAYDLASTEAWDFDVYLSSGYTMPFDHIELEDSYIPEEEA
jgi:uncharacterized protein YhjY with autotransporter beta-barrel domain